MRFAALIAWLSLAATAAAAEVNIDAYALRSRDARDAALASLQQQLADVSKRKVWEKGQKANVLKLLHAQVAGLEDPLRPYYAPLDLSTAASGAVGELRFESVRIRQVIDSSNSIIIASWQRDVVVDVHADRLGNHPIYDDKTFERDFWLGKVSTAGAADDGKLILQGIFFVAGTKQYATAGNSSRTILLLEPIDVADHRDKFTRKDEARTWTSAAGGHETTAIFLGYERGAATLVTLEGKRLRVPLSKLSEADRQFILERNAAAKR
jgi:hypothetical protein